MAMSEWTERRTVPSIGQYDVVVCGGGPAGIAAALSAARQGLQVLLVEAGGCLGGVWTSGQLALVLDVEGKGGIMGELKSRLNKAGAEIPRGNVHDFIYDPEFMKWLLEDLCRESKVNVLLHTRVVSTWAADGKICAVALENSQGRTAVEGKLFIDCTGNGDLAALAGCGYDMGRDNNGQIQPASMLAVVTGVPEAFRSMETYERKREFGAYLQGLSCSTSNKAPTIIELPVNGLYLLSVNHQFGVRCDDAKAITDATIQGRAEIHKVIHALRERGGWDRLQLVSTASHIALREGRRIRGTYTITLQDIVEGRKFKDGVCTVKFAVDIHATDAAKMHGYGNEGIVTKPYHIPYRSLVAAEVDNLALAGRCISGEFYAHASYRVTANAVAMGEAVGFASVEALVSGGNYKNVQGERVAEEMKKRGYVL